MTNQNPPQTEIQKATEGALLPDATAYLEEILLVALMTPENGGDPRKDCNMGLATVLWGLSGTAKSAIIKSVARKLSLHVEVVYPGTHAPEDFSSLPVVIQEQLVAACMLSQVTTLNAMGGGLLFLDEVSCAAPAVQGAMLSMVLDRRVGAVMFHPNIRILLAANPPKYAAGGWSLEAPFSNREAHFYVSKPPRDKLVNYILTEGMEQTTTLVEAHNMLMQNWGTEWTRSKGMWVGLVEAHDSIRHQQPDPDNPQSGYCWPSDRSWEFAFRAAATARCLGKSKLIEQLLIEACVGEGAASEYLAWAAAFDLPDARDVLVNGWRIPPQLDRIHAVFANLTTLVIDQPDGNDKYKMAAQAWKRLQELSDVGHLDIVATHAQTLIGGKLGPMNTTGEIKSVASPVLLKLGEANHIINQF